MYACYFVYNIRVESFRRDEQVEFPLAVGASYTSATFLRAPNSSSLMYNAFQTKMGSFNFVKNTTQIYGL
jgi:hypothetical protein